MIFTGDSTAIAGAFTRRSGGNSAGVRQNYDLWLAVAEFDADDVSRESFCRTAFCIELPALTAIARAVTTAAVDAPPGPG